MALSRLENPFEGMPLPACEKDGGCPYRDRCNGEEAALRHFTYKRPNWPEMTPQQREWCFSEIDSVEGYHRGEVLMAEDAALAETVLDAWADYCRDKGLM